MRRQKPRKYRPGDLVRSTWEFPDDYNHYEGSDEIFKRPMADLAGKVAVVLREDEEDGDYLVEYACGSRLVFGAEWLKPASPLEKLAHAAEKSNDHDG